jgi:DNA-binding GntR family transcriptional regulator
VPLNPVQLPRRRSRANELYDWLRAAIVSGELQGHERLVETSIAELASVSRTPVREALQRLEVDGLVQVAEGGGLEVVGFSLDELADLCAVRETLEGMATSLAAVARSELEIANLQAIVQAERRLFDAEGESALQGRVELNHSFHETLWGASRNRYLADQLGRLRSLIERMQDSTLSDRDRIAEAIKEHEAIIEALAVRDAADAERLARQHFRNAMSRRLERSGTYGAPPAARSAALDATAVL